MHVLEWNAKRYECVVVRFDSLIEQHEYRVEMKGKGYTETQIGVYEGDVWLFSKMNNFDLIKNGKEA